VIRHDLNAMKAARASLEDALLILRESGRVRPEACLPDVAVMVVSLQTVRRGSGGTSEKTAKTKKSECSDSGSGAWGHLHQD
jgi:hypothetical protein